jgi:hypothetical protein
VKGVAVSRFLILCLLLWQFGFADQQYLIDGDTFRHHGLGLSFRIPQGWGPEPITIQDEKAIFRLVAPTGRTSMVLLLSPHQESSAEGKSDEQVLQELEKSVAKAIRGFHFTRVNTRKIGSRTLLEMSASASAGNRLHRLAVIPDGPKVCLLWMQTNKDTFPQYLPSFEGVLKSIEWQAVTPTQGDS